MVHGQGVIGFWPANAATGDDIEVYADEARKFPRRDLAHAAPAAGQARRAPNFCAVRFHRAEGQRQTDYIGGFVVTAGIGERRTSPSFEPPMTTTPRSCCKALADRLAEAFAERLHERVRREFWGYAPDETLANDELIAEKYRGIRPAPGYPAQPDHTEKATLFALLDATNTPASS
jgi:5-methyltetrahydrofolate--homocysteine methyltransferase